LAEALQKRNLLFSLMEVLLLNSIIHFKFLNNLIGMHAREWIGPAIVTFFMQELLVNQTENQDILDGMDIYITPIANPDG
jgi:hypothetical protein